jgi:pimeloyl-ACP methyl ester carboxylesterase
MSTVLSLERLEDRALLHGSKIAILVNGLGGAGPGESPNTAIANVFSSLGFNEVIGLDWNQGSTPSDPGGFGLGLTYSTVLGVNIPTGIGATVDIGNPNTNHAFVTYAQQLLANVDTTDHVVIVGYSLGGSSALDLARALPNTHIDMLALLDPVGYAPSNNVLPTLSTAGALSHFVGPLGFGIGFDQNGGENADGNTPGFRSGEFGGGLPSVPANVGYFFNRWQTNGPFPLDFPESGTLSTDSSATISNQAVQNSTDRYGISDPKDFALAFLEGQVDLNPTITVGGIIPTPIPNPNFLTTTAQQHFNFYQNSTVVADLTGALKSIIPPTIFAPAGNDSISVSADPNNAAAILVTINGVAQSVTPVKGEVDIQGSNGQDTLSLDLSHGPLPSGTVVVFDGGTGPNTVIGPSQTNNWIISGANSGSLDGVIAFGNVENLTGGNQSDSFEFLPGGSITGNINGGGGSDTLDYSSLAGPVTVNLQTGTASRIAGTFSNISNFVGSTSSADLLVGPDATWDIGGSNAGSVNGSTFSSFENLTGGAGNDQFVFLPGGSISGNIDGGGGTNTLDYSNLVGPVTVNLQNRTGANIGGTFANISNFIGSSSPSDTLIGPDGGATWDINGTNAGSVNGSTFSSFENLTGGAGNDQFVFLPGGSISGNLDGGGGGNTLDYSNLPGPITLNLQTDMATNIGGTFANITNFIGSSGSNLVVGPDAPSTYTVTGVNTFSVNGLSLIGFQSITGGAGDDQFFIQTGGRLDGQIDGGGGTNTLLYSNFSGDVVVDLSLNSATAIGQGVFHIQNVTGSEGNSLIVGDTNPNVLIGGTGRSILIGDAGADTIIGGGGDNILIGDSTIYDQNMTALLAINAEWTRTDLSFEQRLAHLISNGINDGRLNGSYVFNKKTVFSDGSVDTLTDGGGLNWVFVTLGEDVWSSKKPGDHQTVL